MKGPVDELCSTFWIETGHPHEGEDPRETIKVFSIHILNLVTRLLVDPEPYVTFMNLELNTSHSANQFSAEMLRNSVSTSELRWSI